MDNNINIKYQACPIRNVIAKFGDKWSLLVLYHLHLNGTLRFSDLQRQMADCSQKMLSATLKKLEQTGLIARTVYPEVPPRVEYSLTPMGTSLMPIVDDLIKWALVHFSDVVRP